MRKVKRFLFLLFLRHMRRHAFTLMCNEKENQSRLASVTQTMNTAVWSGAL